MDGKCYEQITTFFIIQNGSHEWILDFLVKTLSLVKLSVLQEEKVMLGNETSAEFQWRIRSIKFIESFKATEFRTWLLYVAPAVIKHFLTTEQYRHFCLVLHGIHVLFLTQVSIERNLVTTQTYINGLLQQWPRFYTDSALSFVVQATEHLLDV